MMRRARLTPMLFEPLEGRVLLAAAPVTFTDADGSVVTAKLSGNGNITLIEDGDLHSLVLTGTDQGTTLSISIKGGDGRARFKNITTSGAMKSISGKTTDITGDLSIAGSIKTLTLGNFPAGTQQTLAIGGTSEADASTISLGRVADLLIQSGAPIKKLTVVDWDDTDANDKIVAPVIEKIESKEDFAPGASLKDDNYNKPLLGELKVKGLLGGVWTIESGTGKISAGVVGENFSMNATDTIKSVDVSGDFRGVLASTEIGKINIKGSVIGAHILAGADLGDDAQLGGTGDNQDLYFKGEIKGLTVKGEVRNSVIGVGLDPVNGVFGDGNDIVTGKTRSSFGSISIKGVADALTVLAAGKFSKVSIAGTKTVPAGDPRFVLASTEKDETPPAIVASLENDTNTPDDNITSDPTLVGRVTDLGKIEYFRFGVDDMPLSDFTSILSTIEPNGMFELLRTKIEQANKGPLSPGLHRINLIAKDDVGNTSAILTIALVIVP